MPRNAYGTFTWTVGHETFDIENVDWRDFVWTTPPPAEDLPRIYREFLDREARRLTPQVVTVPDRPDCTFDDWSEAAHAAAEYDGWSLDDAGDYDDEVSVVAAGQFGMTFDEALLARVYEGRDPIHILARKILRTVNMAEYERCREAAERMAR